MKIRSGHIILSLFLLLSPFYSFCQTFNQFVRNGDREFAEGDYYSASVYYGKAMELNDHRIDINYKFAEASRLFNDYGSAAEVYGMVLADDNYLNFPLAEYWQAVALKYKGVYDESLKHFKRFAGRYRPKDIFKESALNEIQNMPFTIELIKDTLDVRIEHMGSEVNSPFTEFAASEIKDSLLQFSSIREGQGENADQQIYFSRLYGMIRQNGEWEEAKDFFEDLNIEGKHIANGTFGPDKTSFYFTVCENVTKSELHCGIFVSSYKQGKWKQPRPLSINLPCCTSTQPTVGKNADGDEVLFFASDRSGSKGKLDIWMSTKGASGRFNQPQNLGEVINTPEDEATPFYNSETQVLYFSSKWHAGLGGYDIFKSEKENGQWKKPENLGFPINTSYNDLYFSVDDVEKSGYLTSNRLGSFYIKGETCCNDIFKFSREKVKIDNSLTALADTGSAQLKDSFTVDADTSIEIATISSDTVREVIGMADTTAKRSNADQIIGEMRDLLPITLYFHNDEPDCCTMSDTTLLEYKETYEEYSALLYEYISEYSKGKINAEKDSAEQQIRRLFEEFVDQGMIDLIRFSGLLKEALEIEDRKLEVTIKGYCSPLAINPYNINLAERRIASLRNYFYDYKDGFFNAYLRNSQLNFIQEPIGEEQAPEAVSDNPLDVQNSIYNPDAALERRVYIIAIDAK